MAAITALLLLFAHAAAPFAHASHAQSHLDLSDSRIPARRLLDAGDAAQQARAMQQHSYNSRQAARSLLQVANATTAQAAGQAAGQGAGQGAGLGAGQGAGQGAGAGAGQGAGAGAGQGAGQVASQAPVQATSPPATPAGTAAVSTGASTSQQAAGPGPAQTGPTGVIITDHPPTAVVAPQGAGPGALSGAGTSAVPPGSPVSSGGPALKLCEQCGGQSACNGNTPCADRQWNSSSCALGSTCIRQDEWYWQCRPSSELQQQVGASSADGSDQQNSRQPAGQSNSQPVKGLMGQKDGQHQVMAQQGSTDSTPAAAAATGGGGIRCIKRSGCKPSDGVYGSSDNKRSFAGLLAPAGQCQFFGGCGAVKDRGACRAAWNWQVDAKEQALIQWCGDECPCPGEQ